MLRTIMLRIAPKNRTRSRPARGLIDCVRSCVRSMLCSHRSQRSTGELLSCARVCVYVVWDTTAHLNVPEFNLNSTEYFSCVCVSMFVCGCVHVILHAPFSVRSDYAPCLPEIHLDPLIIVKPIYIVYTYAKQNTHHTSNCVCQAYRATTVVWQQHRHR